MLEQVHDFADLHEAELLATSELEKAGLIRPANRPEGFQLPASIWQAMFVCYAVFIGSLAAATGGSGYARFMLAIAGLFVVIYFSAGAILAAVGGKDSVQAVAGKPLQTIYGPVDANSVRVQVLVVPVALALFGLGILTVASLAGF